MNKIKQRFTWILFISITLQMFGSNIVNAVDRPNILYIFTDDQSFRTVSCYPGAYEYADTPNIDRLAERGILFTNAFTGAKCTPSRASTLTGRFQHNIEKGCLRYWPEDFRGQGYTTGMIGKWHWGKGTESHQHGRAWDWSVVWDHGQKEEATTYYWGQSVNYHGGPPEKLDGYSTDRYSDFAIEFINEQRGQEKPWYLWLCYGAVHGPYTPADRHIGKLKDEPQTPIPSDIFGPRAGKPEYMVNLTRWKKDDDGNPILVRKGETQSFDSIVKQYNEAVCAIDEGVGRVIKALEASGQLDNTIIIFTADQGFAWGQHGLRDKRYAYDAALRSPLIVYAPSRFAQGEVCPQPVNGPDIVRTMHALAGVKPGIPLDGRDFSKLLRHPDDNGSWSDEPMIQTYTSGEYGNDAITKAIKAKDWKKLIFDGSPAWLMLHDGRYKYTRYIAENTIEELYDLEKDLEELDNLAVNIEWHPKLAKLRVKTLDAFRAKGASYVDLIPEPKIKHQP